jgi:GNAT superfamily N-acetyltransferase
MQLIAHHDMTAAEVDWIEDRLYEHNKVATGRSDGEGLGFEVRDEAGEICGVTSGYTWAGISEIKQMWVRADFRGRGLGLALLNAMVDEATRRGVKRIYVASYTFQAPGMYEKAGFARIAEFDGWPDGHVNVILCKAVGEA